MARKVEFQSGLPTPAQSRYKYAGEITDPADLSPRRDVSSNLFDFVKSEIPKGLPNRPTRIYEAPGGPVDMVGPKQPGYEMVGPMQQEQPQPEAAAPEPEQQKRSFLEDITGTLKSISDIIETPGAQRLAAAMAKDPYEKMGRLQRAEKMEETKVKEMLKYQEIRAKKDQQENQRMIDIEKLHNEGLIALDKQAKGHMLTTREAALARDAQAKENAKNRELTRSESGKTRTFKAGESQKDRDFQMDVMSEKYNLEAGLAKIKDDLTHDRFKYQKGVGIVNEHTGEITSKEKDLGISSLEPKEVFKQEQKLAGDFRNLTKNYREVRDAWGRIIIGAEQESGAGDMSLLFAYMKLLDPASTVRESEYAAAKKTGNIPENIIAAYNSAVDGKFLSATQRRNFIKMSQELYKERSMQYRFTESSYKRMAKDYGLNEQRVVLDFKPVDRKKLAELNEELLQADPNSKGLTFEEIDELRWEGVL